MGDFAWLMKAMKKGVTGLVAARRSVCRAIDYVAGRFHILGCPPWELQLDR